MEQRGGDGQVHSLSAACDLLHLGVLKHSGCLHLWTKHCSGGWGGIKFLPPCLQRMQGPGAGRAAGQQPGLCLAALTTWRREARQVPCRPGSSGLILSQSARAVPCGRKAAASLWFQGRPAGGSAGTRDVTPWGASAQPPAPPSRPAGVSPVSLPALAGSLAGPLGLRSASEARPQQARFYTGPAAPLTPGYSEIAASGKRGFTAVMEVTNQRP